MTKVFQDANTGQLYLAVKEIKPKSMEYVELNDGSRLCPGCAKKMINRGNLVSLGDFKFRHDNLEIVGRQKK